jgi:uncharacterized protein YrrD
MDARSLKGIAVVSIDEGEKVGTIDDTIFNLEKKQVIAFRLAKTGLFRGDRNFVTFEDIHSIGPDAVMIQNRSRLHTAKSKYDYSASPGIAKLTSLRVVTEDGAYVGNVANVHFDRRIGVFTEIEVTGESILAVLRRNKVIPANEIVSVGNDVVVVPNSYGENEDHDTIKIPDRVSPPDA